MKNIEKVQQRIRSGVIVSPDGCWEWQRALDPDGYGKAYAEGVPSRGAHRIAYLVFVGEIPAGLEVDHKCFNRACCNPDHLQSITGIENKRNQQRAQATTCKYGHPRSRAPSGIRVCKQCQCDRTNRYKSKMRAA